MMLIKLINVRRFVFAIIDMKIALVALMAIFVGFQSLPLTAGVQKEFYVSTFGNDDVIVYFRGGRYHLNAPVVFSPANSGSSDGKIVYRNYPEEKPIFWSGEIISGIGTGKNFRQLYVNGVKAVRSQKPNQGSSNIMPTEMERSILHFLHFI